MARAHPYSTENSPRTKLNGKITIHCQTVEEQQKRLEIGRGQSSTHTSLRHTYILVNTERVGSGEETWCHLNDQTRNA